MRKAEKQEFIRLYKTGLYTQKEIAKKVGVSEVTTSKWHKSEFAILIDVQKAATKELQKLMKLKNYEQNVPVISNLITDIERVENILNSRILINGRILKGNKANNNDCRKNKPTHTKGQKPRKTDKNGNIS